jgi:hypothetical protein
VLTHESKELAELKIVHGREPLPSRMGDRDSFFETARHFRNYGCKCNKSASGETSVFRPTTDTQANNAFPTEAN